MTTLRVDPEHPDQAVIARAGAVLRDGGLVAFPTETVYGLGANALSGPAVRRIFAAKGRPADNPLIVHVADIQTARRLTREWPESAGRAAAAFWPGPVTLILPKRPEVPDATTAGLDTVAIRVPAHPVALALVRAAGVPVAAPSANPSTAISPTTARHVERGLGDRVDLVLDAGPTPVGIESTVIDLSGPTPVLLRPGTVTPEALERVLGAVAAPGGDPAGVRRSPGLMERHYAPRAQLRLFGVDERSAAERRARVVVEAGGRVGALLLSPLEAPVDRPIQMPEEPAAYARELYAALHTLDEDGCDLILAERVPETREWEGVRDRLRRAAEGAV